MFFLKRYKYNKYMIEKLLKHCLLNLIYKKVYGNSTSNVTYYDT